MYHYDFFLSSSLEKVLADKRPQPMEAGETIPVFPGCIPAVQLVYTRYSSRKHPLYETPFTVSVEGAPVKAIMRSVELVPVDYPARERSDSLYITKKPAMLPDLLIPLKDDTIRPQPDLYNAVWIDFPGIDISHRGRHEIKIIVQAPNEVESENGSRLSDPDAAGYRAELPLVLEVIKEEIPPQTLIHTEWFHTDCLADFYHTEPLSEEHWEIIDAFMEPMAKRYGINAVLTPVFTPPLDTAPGSERPTIQLVDITAEGDTYSFDFSKLERWCSLCKKHGIKYLEIAHFFSQWGARATPKIVAFEGGEEKRIFGWEIPSNSTRYRNFLKQFIPALRDECSKNGFDQGHTIFHVSDEPHGDEIAVYKKAKNQIADLVKGSLIIDALSDISFYRDGVIDHPVPANDAIAPFLEARIPNLWVYYCVAQGRLVPNRFIALPSARQRAMGILMYYYRIAGFLQWGYNYYYSALSKTLINPFFKTGGLKDWPAGDPFLVYPGDDRKPLSSIRGEIHRESLEDMRILSLVESRKGRDSVIKLIHEDFPGKLNFEHYPADPDYYLRLREKAAEIIESAGSYYVDR